MGLQQDLIVMGLCMILSSLPVHGSSVSLPPRRLLQNPPTTFPVRRAQPPSTPGDRTFPLTLSPPNEAFHVSSTTDSSGSPTKSLEPHNPRHSSITLVPSTLPTKGPSEEHVSGPAASHTIPFQKHHHHAKNKYRNSAARPSHPAPPIYVRQGPSVSPFQSTSRYAPSPSPTSPSSHIYMPILQPTISPMGSSFTKTKGPPKSPVMVLPPPPPNDDCASVTCTEPLTYAPPGSPCGCVWPIQVELRLNVAINTFFSLVSELANEIAGSLTVNPGQVRIMGANAASQQLEESTVLINLVPRGVKFDDVTAFSIYKKFWERQVFVKTSVFGTYEVVYVHYPGLPPSPPSSRSSISAIDDGPYGGRENSDQKMKPLGVDVPRRRKSGFNGSIIAVIVLSSFTAFVLCFGIVWLLLLKCGIFARHPEQSSCDFTSSPAKASEAPKSIKYRNMPSSKSMSFDSNAMAYTGSAKTLTLNEIERATNDFDTSRIIGEGGFGIVYRGIMGDGKEVAIKVLKRVDQHGGREFLAEVEMLSRLHHRNLVKLIGICTEGQFRCLVYELVPNGSVESHLHGDDREDVPLDWDARMKIALGAARGLAYLHEDSSPRVIHRDFKSSNILLEHDFTPKVSDFGLARTALDEGNKHISTHVMGTFGYLAPEYAMTGHLLVKSDVYSYGVVLLELLTGRKPVDLSQPPGQENLVAWARPLLTSKEGLEVIIDPVMKSSVSYDTVTKVAAIASMCVQPEVSHRPFMGEVVQALRLVCHELDETKEKGSRDPNDDTISVNQCSGELAEEVDHQAMFGYGKNMGLSTSDLLSTPMGIEGRDSGSFRRDFSSGPLRTGRRKQFWQRLKNLSRGSMSDHGFSSKFWPGSC